MTGGPKGRVEASIVAPPARDAVTDLAEWLAGRPDADIAALLADRRDVASPIPAGFPVLAARLSAGPSIARAAEDADLLSLAVLETLIGLGAARSPVSAAEVYRALKGRALKTQVTARIRGLRARALIWGPDDALRVAHNAREALPWRTPQLTGAAAEATLEGIRAELAACAEDETTVLRRLSEGNPVGRTTAAGDGAPPDHPVRRLLGRGLLSRVDELTVELPYVVGALLRGESPAEPAQLRPPVLDGPAAPDADGAGAVEALELLRHAEAVLELLGASPAPTVRAGGLGVRELHRIAKSTGLDDARAGLVLELLAGADLLAAAMIDEDMIVGPTAGVDAWLRTPAPARWADLAATWLDLRRRPGLVGTRTDEGVIGPLSPNARSTVAPLDRRAVIATLAETPPGTAPAITALQAAVRYAHPRWYRRLSVHSVQQILDEAATVGLVARGAVTAIGRAALDGDRQSVAAAAAVALPDTVETFLLQADLTLTVPGPMAYDFAEALALVADLESAGGASVYRVTEASVRRALDTGRAAAELHGFFAAHASTPVPQSLSYLVDDVARRHGQLRAGVAASFLRSDDPGLIAAVLASPVAVELALRGIAPTVAVCQVPLAELVAGLRAAGFAAAAEDSTGAVVDLRPAPVRLPTPRPRPPGPAAPTAEHLAEAAAQVRRHDGGARSPAAPGTSGTAAVSLLDVARGMSRPVRLGYVDANGTASKQVVVPTFVRNGQVGATTDDGVLRVFSLHRITDVAFAD